MATRGDTFVEAANVDLDAHTPTGANAGTGWTEEEQTGSPVMRVLAANDYVSSSATVADVRNLYTLQPDPVTADIDVQFEMTEVTFGADVRALYLVARFVDAANYYGALTYRANAAADKKIFKRIGGTPTELASGDAGLAVGDVIKFELRGTTLKLYVDGVEILSVTDSALTAAGKAGVGSGNGFVSTDDIGPFGFKAFQYVEVAAAGGSIPFPPVRMPAALLGR